MIKKIIGLIVGLIALLIVVGVILMFVMPTDFNVEREVTINKPKSEVHNYVKFIKNQSDWGPWVKKDPEIKLNHTGTDGEVGFISAWESKMEDVGSGEQEIKKITDDQIDTEIRFKIPFESTTASYLKLEETDSTKTNVKWGFAGSMPRPWNLMLLMVDMEQEVGKDFEAGLKNLKEILEKQDDTSEQ